MARHAKVGKQSINMLHSVVAHPILEVAEVAPYEGKSFISLRNVLLGIGILVEAIKVGFGVEPTQYLAAMTATAEGHIDVYAAWLNVESVYGFV